MPLETVTISSLGSNITSSEIQLYSGTCGVLTSIACHANSITQGGLTVGATYYVRVSNIGSSPSSNGGFNICVTHTGFVNNLCTAAIVLTSGYTCSATTGTLTGATYTAFPGDCGGGGGRPDVWYSFVAQTTNPTIDMPTQVANQRIQLFSGSCGSLI